MLVTTDLMKNLHYNWKINYLTKLNIFDQQFLKSIMMDQKKFKKEGTWDRWIVGKKVQTVLLWTTSTQ